MGSYSNKIKQLISIADGVITAHEYCTYKVTNLDILQKTVKTVLHDIPIEYAKCVPMSSILAAYLLDNHNIPAIVIAGDLKIQGEKCFQNL